MCRANARCVACSAGIVSGLKFDLWIQPNALVLSPTLKKQSPDFHSVLRSMHTSCVMQAKYSKIFCDFLCWSSIGTAHLHARPDVKSKPPMPPSKASDRPRWSGSRMIILFRLTPRLATASKCLCNRRSRLSSAVNLVVGLAPFFSFGRNFARSIAPYIRLWKCMAPGTTIATLMLRP
jgi:hypothetical protein